SRARAEKVWLPLASPAVLYETEKGAVVSSAPALAPSTRNCTPATPTLSAALAETVMVPETVAPAAGAVIATVGGVVSGAVSTKLQTVSAPPSVAATQLPRLVTVACSVRK